MRLALQQARLAAEVDEVPVGAVVVLDGAVIASAHNKQICLNNPTGHAEILAIELAADKLQNYRLPGCSLYVTLEPCLMCVGAMIHARIDRLIFAASDPKTGMVDTVDQQFNKPYHNHRIQSQGGVLEAPCKQLLQDFFRGKRALKKPKN